jgi:hypothetical protein
VPQADDEALTYIFLVRLQESQSTLLFVLNYMRQLGPAYFLYASRQTVSGAGAALLPSLLTDLVAVEIGAWLR